MAHIVIGEDETCTCSCESKCIIGKTGSAHRCTKAEIVEQGFGVVKLKRNFFGRVKLADKVKFINV